MKKIILILLIISMLSCSESGSNQDRANPTSHFVDIENIGPSTFSIHTILFPHNGTYSYHDLQKAQDYFTAHSFVGMSLEYIDREFEHIPHIDNPNGFKLPVGTINDRRIGLRLVGETSSVLVIFTLGPTSEVTGQYIFYII
jgi:hypothetical protein